jgi:predicted outer membrane repeat protein
VDTLNDTPDTNVGDGLARDANNNTSLRAAIMEGNAAQDASVTVNFQGGLTGTISLSEQLPNFAKNYTIQGPGSNTLTVERKADAANFRIFFNDVSYTSAIVGLTITGGNAGAGGGGAIRNSGNLTLTSCVLSYNTALHGGAIYNIGNLTISGCGLYENQATGSGGAIFSESGVVTVTAGSDISYNAALQGGGISIYRRGTLRIWENSQIYGNTANYGGGIYNSGARVEMITGYLGYNMAITGTDGRGGGYYGENNENSGVATFQQVNFDQNQADFRGGGFYLAAGTLTIDSCTFSGNGAPTGTAGYVQLGATLNPNNNELGTGQYVAYEQIPPE